MIAFLKYLKGYVRIKVWGFSPERFMNLCSNKNILLWDIQKDGDIYYMNISLQGFYKLRPIVRKTGTRAAILKRCGLPFLIPKVLARKIFVLGLLAAVFFWYWSSLYVWEITLEGNHSITEDIFWDFLEEQKIEVGMLRKHVDIENLEKEIRRNFDIVTWTSARQDGTKLEIVIRENQNIIPPKEDEHYPFGSDLVADVSGTIVSMIVRKGIPQVEIGQEITQENLLVAGNVPVYNEDATVRRYQYTRADADIYVEHTIEIEESLSFFYTDKEYTGREKKKYYIQLGEKEYKLFFEEIDYPYYDVVMNKNNIQLLKGLSLPFYFGDFIYREYLNVERCYTPQEAEKILGEKYAKILSTLEEKGVQIITKDVKIDNNSNMWILHGTLTVVEKTGTEVAIRQPDSGESGTEADRIDE